MAHFLVIAASSGIGQATVSLLKQAGHTVWTTARDTSKITPDAILDATDFQAVEAVFKQAGDIDGVVNCSGSLFLKSAHLTSKEQYQAVMDASLTTAFATVRAAGKVMNKGGSVVLISSAAAMEGLSNHEAIAAAKAGILQFLSHCRGGGLAQLKTLPQGIYGCGSLVVMLPAAVGPSHELVGIHGQLAVDPLQTDLIGVAFD